MKLAGLSLLVISVSLLITSFAQDTNETDAGKNIRLTYGYSDRLGLPSSESPGLLEVEAKVTLLLAGDVMLGRTVMSKSLEEKDLVYSFRNVKNRLSTADITFVNLENPIVENCSLHFTGFKFCASEEMVEGLVESGVDIVTLANNHSRNYGKKGLNNTVKVLSSKKIYSTGLGRMEIIERDGLKFGFIGFDFVSSKPKDIDYDLVQSSDDQVDVLVVGIHWGAEYTAEPKEFQRDWAKEFVVSGADVIVGHHPHWVQSIEYYDVAGSTFYTLQGSTLKGRVPVYYSLGNFVFDQMWSEETKKGMVIELDFDKQGKIVDERRLETYMSSWAQPEFVD